MRKVILLILIVSSSPLLTAVSFAQSSGEFQIARAKYRGGGDWYNDPSALKNLIQFTKNVAPIHIDLSYQDVSIGSAELHAYPFVFLTGHGNKIGRAHV